MSKTCSDFNNCVSQNRFFLLFNQINTLSYYSVEQKNNFILILKIGSKVQQFEEFFHFHFCFSDVVIFV